MGRVLDTVAPIAGAVLGSIFLPGLGTSLGLEIGSGVGGALGSGLATGITQHSARAGLLGGLGSFAGNALGSALGGGLGTFGNPGSALGGEAGNAIGPSFGSIGGAASSGFGSLLGDATANSIGAGLANTSIGGALGSFAGNSLSAGSPMPQAPSGPPAFHPSQQAQAALPSSLSDFSNLSPLQQSTNLATQGVYGGGLGPEEQQYFLNLENRRLVDSSGHTSDQSSLSPIEGSYLSRLGLGGRPDTSSLLQAISQWGPS